MVADAQAVADSDSRGTRPAARGRWKIWVLCCLCVGAVLASAALAVGFRYRVGAQRLEMTWEEVKEALVNGEVEELVIYVDGSGPYSGVLRSGTAKSAASSRRFQTPVGWIPWPALTDKEKEWLLAAARKTGTVISCKQGSRWNFWQ